MYNLYQQVGSVIIYDTEDQLVLRKIGAGYHEIDSVAIDHNYNFVITANKPEEHMVVKYNLKGDQVSG